MSIFINSTFSAIAEGIYSFILKIKKINRTEMKPI